MDISVAFALSDIKAQLGQLDFSWFLLPRMDETSGGYSRYLSAIEKRMENWPLILTVIALK